MRTPATLAALAVVAGVFASGCASSKGYEKSEDVADDIHDTAVAVDAYGTHREASFHSINALVAAPFEDLPAKFERFSRCVDRVRSSEGTLRTALSTMKVAGDKRFQEWGRQNDAFTDDDMQDRARQSRAVASESFRQAGADTEAMLATSAGFVTYLSDLRNLLANDLTEESVAGVKEFAAKARVANGELDGMARLTLRSLEAASDAMSSKTYPE